MTAINLPIYFGGSRVVSSSADAASLINAYARTFILSASLGTDADKAAAATKSGGITAAVSAVLADTTKDEAAKIAALSTIAAGM